MTVIKQIYVRGNLGNSWVGPLRRYFSVINCDVNHLITMKRKLILFGGFRMLYKDYVAHGINCHVVEVRWIKLWSNCNT